MKTFALFKHITFTIGFKAYKSLLDFALHWDITYKFSAENSIVFQLLTCLPLLISNPRNLTCESQVLLVDSTSKGINYWALPLFSNSAALSSLNFLITFIAHFNCIDTVTHQKIKKSHFQFRSILWCGSLTITRVIVAAVKTKILQWKAWTVGEQAGMVYNSTTAYH